MSPNVGWELVAAVQFNEDVRVVNLSQNFTSDSLIIVSESEGSRPYWYKAGFVQQEYSVPGFEKVYAVSELLGLQSQLVRFNTDLIPYKVSLVRVPWLPDLTCSVYQPI